MPDHLLERTDEWRTSALHFKEFGKYTNLTPNPAPNSPYMKFWKEERRRCIEGYHCGWDYIPGYYYFYLNYSPIIKVEALNKSDETLEESTQIRAERIEGFPDVWDGDYDYFQYLEEAEKSGSHGAVLKTRGRGYSFKGGSMLNRNFFLIPKSKSYAVASESEFLTKDGILTKAWANMNFIDQNTPWKKLRQVKNTEMHKRASYLSSGVEKGYMSEIIGVTLKDDPQKARGKRGKLILWEEAGKFPGLLQAWQIARPSMEQGRYTFGLMVAFGTGGTEGANFESLEKLFYKPKAYRVHPIPNRWDEGKQNTFCGYFHGEQTNFSGVPALKYIDKYGNSNEEEAIKEILAERDEMRLNGADANSILQHIAEKPISPSEAVLRTSGFYFPVAQLKRHLAEIEQNKEKYIDANWVGRLEFHSELGNLEWKTDLELQPIRDYPGLIEEGAIEIFEMPQKDALGKVPFGTYIGGIDPVDKEKTSYTESLGSILIMNRWTRRIVAEYTGRPDNPKTFYENCRRLLMFYNATGMYENQLTGIFTHFEHKKSLHLLADTPTQMRDNMTWKENTNASKGMPASERTNSRGREYIKSWLLDAISNGSEILNYQKIKSIGLLKELIAWNPDGNFDRVSALGMLMWYDETLYRPEQEIIKKAKTIMDDPYWKEMGVVDNNDTYNYIRNVIR